MKNPFRKTTSPEGLLTPQQTERYARRFKPAMLWRKIIGSGRRAGYRTVELALTLYFTARAPETPVWCKTVIFGALGYFISLIDGIPDLTPVLGYTDDVGVMVSALAMLSQYVTPEIRAQATAQADRLLPQDVTAAAHKQTVTDDIEENQANHEAKD